MPNLHAVLTGIDEKTQMPFSINVHDLVSMIVIENSKSGKKLVVVTYNDATSQTSELTEELDIFIKKQLKTNVHALTGKELEKFEEDNKEKIEEAQEFYTWVDNNRTTLDSAKYYCILETATGFMDGCYCVDSADTTTEEQAETMRKYWDSERERYSHAIIYLKKHYPIPDERFLANIHHGLKGVDKS